MATNDRLEASSKGVKYIPLFYDPFVRIETPPDIFFNTSDTSITSILPLFPYFRWFKHIEGEGGVKKMSEIS